MMVANLQKKSHVGTLGILCNTKTNLISPGDKLKYKIYYVIVIHIAKSMLFFANVSQLKLNLLAYLLMYLTF